MGPEALAQVLRPLADLFDAASFPDLIRGLDEPDDALVWKLDDERALVHTADFFPPVVDDPFDFGSIAAANALSDVYAMGGDPLFAINLVGWPESLDPTLLAEVLRGGAEKVREAGAVVAGGHTTIDREPKYGLAVTGLVHPEKVLGKRGARPGDVVLLTKPIGTGVVTTAHKRGSARDGDLAEAVRSMARLSRAAVRVFREAAPAVHALTDITGFSLAGHALEIAEASGVAFEIDAGALPILPGAWEYAAAGAVPGGTRRNEAFYGPRVEWPDAGDVDRALLFDPQTSGGLLAAVDRRAAGRIVDALAAAGEPVRRLGSVVASPLPRLRLEGRTTV